jgi:hypothetical protein
MPEFSIGVVSVVCGLFLAAATLIGYLVAKFISWYKRAAPPKDRIVFGVVAMGCVGFIAGCFAQPQWDKAVTCRADGKPVIKCVFFPSQA